MQNSGLKKLQELNKNSQEKIKSAQNYKPWHDSPEWKAIHSEFREKLNFIEDFSPSSRYSERMRLTKKLREQQEEIKKAFENNTLSICKGKDFSEFQDQG